LKKDADMNQIHRLLVAAYIATVSPLDWLQLPTKIQQTQQ
jgi:hypothetical protein